MIRQILFKCFLSIQVKHKKIQIKKGFSSNLKALCIPTTHLTYIHTPLYLDTQN